MENTTLFAPYLAGLVVMLVSLIGVVTTFGLLRSYAQKHINLLASFSAGVYLIVGSLLVWEIFEHEEIRNIGLASLAIGVLAMIALGRLPDFHHHHAKDEELTQHSKSSIKRILLSDALHNIGDGALIGVAFAANTSLGIATTIGIIVHESLQELAEFFLLRQAGYSVKKALSVNLLISSTVFIGITLSLLVAQFEILEGVILGLASGAILSVVFQDLIPKSVKTSRKEKKIIKHTLAFALGLVLMFAISQFLGH